VMLYLASSSASSEFAKAIFTAPFSANLKDMLLDVDHLLSFL